MAVTPVAPVADHPRSYPIAPPAPMPSPSVASGTPAAPVPVRRPGAKDRVGLTIAAVATVLGLWLGLVGPGTSPVAPVVPATSVTSVPAPATPAPGTP